MQHRTSRLRPATMISLATLLFTSTFLLAGPLTPSLGPVTSTHKTLTEMEPRTAVTAANTPGDAACVIRITQPGSYYLTGNVQGVSSKSGIIIAAANVTLDLNGFQVIGIPGAQHGITTLENLKNISIKNGSIANWPGSGLTIGAGTAGGHIDSVSASDCGVEGIDVRDGYLITNCRAKSNSGNGIVAGNSARITDCVATSNGGAGILAASGCVVTGCAATANTGYGISLHGGCTVSACSAASNLSSGIRVVTASTIVDCTAYSNTGNGIQILDDCIVKNCTMHVNGLAGLHVLASDNRIEGNQCTNNTRGIDVDANGCIIIRNVCSGNGNNWDIVAGNVCLVVNGVTAAAISGNSGGASPGSTDPNTNFSY